MPFKTHDGVSEEAHNHEKSRTTRSTVRGTPNVYPYLTQSFVVTTEGDDSEEEDYRPPWSPRPEDQDEVSDRDRRPRLYPSTAVAAFSSDIQAILDQLAPHFRKFVEEMPGAYEALKAACSEIEFNEVLRRLLQIWRIWEWPFLPLLSVQSALGWGNSAQQHEKRSQNKAADDAMWWTVASSRWEPTQGARHRRNPSEQRMKPAHGSKVKNSPSVRLSLPNELPQPSAHDEFNHVPEGPSFELPPSEWVEQHDEEVMAEPEPDDIPVQGYSSVSIKEFPPISSGAGRLDSWDKVLLAAMSSAIASFWFWTLRLRKDHYESAEDAAVSEPVALPRFAGISASEGAICPDRIVTNIRHDASHPNPPPFTINNETVLIVLDQPPHPPLKIKVEGDKAPVFALGKDMPRLAQLSGVPDITEIVYGYRENGRFKRVMQIEGSPEVIDALREDRTITAVELH